MLTFRVSFFFFFLFFLFSGSFSASSSVTDFEALQSFKDSLLEPSQVLSSSWVNSSNPCLDSWFGVTCNPRNHRVTRLVLENLNLTGSFDSLTRLSQLRLLSLKNNSISSSSTFNFSSWRNIKHIYLSYNRFSGPFPFGVSRVRRLLRLDLSYNNFSGDIPMDELASMPHLLTLRLQANSFTGKMKFANSSSPIVEFNVSDNNLSGKIPAWLSKFPASCFSGNDNLCGMPLQRECPKPTVKSQPVPAEPTKSVPETKTDNWPVLLIIGIDAAAILAVVVSITYCCYYRKRNNRSQSESLTRKAISRRKSGSRSQIGGGYYYGGGGLSLSLREGGGDDQMVVFEGCKGFNNVEDLLKSSAELLGKGSVGTTYKVDIDGGDVVVVKRVRERRRRRDFDGWLRLIGGLRHSNVVSLRAYYNAKDELLLIYDFLPNGSLHTLLHGNRGPGRTPLEWRSRLKLASGAAKGLAFLHGYNKAKLFHGNLTSSNILVDETGNSSIADIGLHQLVQIQSPTFSNNGYKPPELTPPNSKYTQRCDVYSFGVILLEILTGKIPSGEGETSLVRWVQRVKREEWPWEIFDFELLRCKEMEDEMVGLMQVALLCVAPLPRDRPKMNMVLRMIEDIRTKNEGGSTSSILNDISSDSSPSPSPS